MTGRYQIKFHKIDISNKMQRTTQSHIHCVSRAVRPKNVTTVSRQNSNIRDLTLITFSTNVTEKVDNQKILYLPTDRP